MTTHDDTPDIVAILGPTATGKTALAARLADRLNGEVISADSRQVYCSMTIGTGKDYADYFVKGRAVPYHLIDIVEAGTEYNLFQYRQDFLKAFVDIRKRGKMPVLCGGSGMYIEAVLKGYDMMTVPHNAALRKELASQNDDALRRKLAGMRQLHNISDTSDRGRLERAIEIAIFQRDHAPEQPFPKLRSLAFGIHFERSVLRERITERLRKRLKEGLIDEVKQLMKKGVSVETLKYYGLEYRYATSFIIGELSEVKMVEGLNTAIHQFAKRQMTWFRRMERGGMPIHWIDGSLPTDQKISNILSNIQHK